MVEQSSNSAESKHLGRHQVWAACPPGAPRTETLIRPWSSVSRLMIRSLSPTGTTRTTNPFVLIMCHVLNAAVRYDCPVPGCAECRAGCASPLAHLHKQARDSRGIRVSSSMLQPGLCANILQHRALFADQNAFMRILIAVDNGTDHQHASRSGSPDFLKCFNFHGDAMRYFRMRLQQHLFADQFSCHGPFCLVRQRIQRVIARSCRQNDA